MSFDFLIIPNYSAQIDRLAFPKRKCTPEEIQDKAKSAYDGFIEKIGIFPKDDIEFSTSIIKTFKEIALLKPGRSLLKRLTKSLGERIYKIYDCISSNNCQPEFKPDTGAIYVSPLLKLFYISEQKLKDHPFLIQKIHESLHALHYFETPEVFLKRFSVLNPFGFLSKNLLSPKFSNPEEQLTIIGVLDKNDPVELCENVFLRAMGLPFRETHIGGLVLNSEHANLGLDHMIYADAPKDVENLLQKHPEAVNQIYKIDWLSSSDDSKPYAHKKLLPITFACSLLKDEMIALLMDQPLQLHLEDDFGGPIIACINDSNFHLPKQMIAKGVESGQKMPLQKIWETLITVWQTKLSNTHTKEFKDLLFYLNARLTCSDKPNAALFFSAFKGLTHYQLLNLVEWMINDNISLIGVDEFGNSLLLHLLIKISEFKKPFIHRMPITKKFLELIAHPELDPYHENKQGDTVLSLTHKIGAEIITELVKKALDDRGTN